jgi:hypothetical protein
MVFHELLIHSALRECLTSIKNEIQNKETELSRLRCEKVDLEEELKSLTGLVNSRKRELSYNIDQIQRYENLILRSKNRGEYQTVRAIAERHIRDLLAENRPILIAALWGVIKALARDPDLKLLITGSFASPIYNPDSGIPPQNYVHYLQAEVLKLAEEIQNDLLVQCVNNTMSSTLEFFSGHPSFPRSRRR